MALIDQIQAGEFTPIFSYATLDYARDYFASKLSDMAFWNDKLTEDEQTAALKEATLHMDELVYIGRKLYVAQEREWPRYLNLGTAGDIFYLETKILPDVANACCEQAIYIARLVKFGHDVSARQDHQMQGASSITRVGASESYDLNKARRHQLCRRAYQILLPYIAKTGVLKTRFDPTAGFRSTF